MAIDIATHPGGREQIEIVNAAEQTHVIDLRDSGHETLQQAGQHVAVEILTECIKVGAIDLVEIQRRSGTDREMTRAPRM